MKKLSGNQWASHYAQCKSLEQQGTLSPQEQQRKLRHKPRVFVALDMLFLLAVDLSLQDVQLLTVASSERGRESPCCHHQCCVGAWGQRGDSPKTSGAPIMICDLSVTRST